jgi:YD repeat-containing protein
VEGEIVDRPSQASVPVTPMRADDPRILAAAAKNAQAPGPATKTGPGEVPAVAQKALPVGTPPAMDFIGTDKPAEAAPKANGVVVEAAEIRIPAPPDESKLDAKTKAKRRKFDEKTSKRSERTATATKFTNADGSTTAAIGLSGSALDAAGLVVDEDAKFVSDGKDRLKRSAGVVRVNVPEVLTDGVEVVSLGVPGARIGFGVRRTTNAVPSSAPTSSTATPTTTTTTSLVVPGVASISTTIAGSGSGSTTSTAPATTTSTTTTSSSTTSTSTTTVARKVVAPIPAVSTANSATYRDVFEPGSDLRYFVSEGGVKEEIVLNAPPAAGEAVYRFPLKLDGYTARANPVGTISFLDAKGVEQWVIPVATAWEQPAPGSRPLVFGKVAIAIEKNADGGEDLVVRPDENWLRDSTRKYPVIVDPTITPGQNAYGNAYGYVDSAYPTTHLIQCSTWDTACFGTYSSPPHVAYSYLRYDTSAVAGSAIFSADLKLQVNSCVSFPATVKVSVLSSPFDPGSVVWSSRPALRNGSDSITTSVSAAGVTSIPVGWALAKYASGEWPSYGFQIQSGGQCEIRVVGPGSSYLEVVYGPPGANRQPTEPVNQTPVSGGSVTSPVTFSASSTDPDGDPLQFYFQGCRQPCATSGVSFDSGWINANSWTYPVPVAGETWQWWTFAWDGITAYIYNGGTAFTVAAAPTALFQENWAWGTSPDYSTLSTDNQPNSGVNTGTKRFVYESKDAQVAWSGPALAIVRTYNSAETSVGAFGLGWSTLFDARVDSDVNGNLTFRLPDGRREYHPTIGAQTYLTQPGYWSTASADTSNGGWALVEKDGTTWRFLPNGRLSAVVDRNGRTLLLVHDATQTKVTELRAVGFNSLRSLMITWTGSQVASVTDGLNQTWNYAYTGTTLSKACDPRNNNIATGSCVTHGYDASNRLNALTKPGGNKDFEVGYYADSTVQWRKNGMGNQWNYTYNTATRTSTTTDPLGRQTIEQYNALDQIVARTEPGDGNIATQTTTYTYDSNGYLTKSTSPLGSWEYRNDYRGNRYMITDPRGGQSFYSFDNRDLLIAYREARSFGPLDNTYLWTYGYDANGNRVRETNPFGWSRTWTYESATTQLPGSMKQEVDWNGNATNYAYSTAIGDLVEIVYPGITGDKVQYLFDVLGRKTQEIGRMGNPGIVYTYDALNAPLTITEPPVTNPISGVVHQKRTTITYNANHLKATEVVSDVGGAATPDASQTTTYGYDLADRPTSENGPLAKNNSRIYDAVGNITETTDPDGTKISTAFNARDLPSQLTVLNFVDPTTATAAANKTLETRGYDGAGRMTTNTDALGRTRTFTYDAMNRLKTQTLNSFTDRNGAVRSIIELQRSYDQVGNKVGESTGSGALEFIHQFDTAGRLFLTINVSQPRYDFFTLDRNGNVTNGYRQADGGGSLAEKTTTYDARNRPLTISAYVGGAAPNRTSTYTYTKWGTVATEVDPRSALTTYAYDVLGRVSSITAPSVSHEAVGGTAAVSSSVITKGYDTFGNVTHERDPKNQVTISTFDGQNRRTRVDYPSCTIGCQPAATNEIWTYSNSGQVLTHRNPRSYTTSYLYDTLKRNVRVTLPQVGTAPAATRVTHFNLKGNPMDSTNEIGAFSSFTYNELDLTKTASITDRFPSTQNSTVTYDYNDLGQRIWERDPLLNVTTYEFLQTGEMTKTTDPIGAVMLYEYDALGRQTKSTDPLGRIVTTSYNGASEVVAVSRVFGGATISTATAAYDNVGNLVSETSAELNQKNYTYDLMNRPVSVQVPLAVGAITTTYGYDKNSNLTRVTDGKGAVTTYLYNQRNFQYRMIEPATTAFPAVADRTYNVNYDGGGLPFAETKPGMAIQRTFNPLGHPLTELWSGTGYAGVSKDFSFDALGRATQLSSTGGLTYQYNYNDKNQLLQSKNATDTLNDNTFTYDASGRMTAKTDKAGAFAFNYNARNDLTGITDPISGFRVQAFNAAGQLTYVTQGTTLRTFGFDNAGRLASDELKNWSSNAVLNLETYGYNADDNLTSETNSGNGRIGSHTYTYDKAERIASWTTSTGTTSYTYDGAGNRLTAGSATYTYDARNRMLTGPASTYVWKNRGSPVSQTVSGVTTTYTTDAAERITSSARTGYTATNTYDVLDRVVSRTAAGVNTLPRYAGFGLEPTAILPSNQVGFVSQFARSLNGQLLAEKTNGVSAAVALDRHGDAIMWYPTTGVPISAYKVYDPFGAITKTSGGAQSALGFQGQFTDATTGDVNMGCSLV